MTGLLPALLVVTAAYAGGGTPHHEKGKHKVVGPPLRMGSYAALRGGVTPAAGFELNSQLLANGRWGLDLGGTISTSQRVSDFEPWREFHSVGVVVDGVYALTPTVTVGPSATLAFRPFVQDWRQIGGTWTPSAGLRLTSGLLSARSWQLHLTARATVDLVQTRMVFATAEVQHLNPVEVQLGARFLFARRRGPQLPEARD